jgi:hypothetical protein
VHVVYGGVMKIVDEAGVLLATYSGAGKFHVVAAGTVVCVVDEQGWKLRLPPRSVVPGETVVVDDPMLR